MQNVKRCMDILVVLSDYTVGIGITEISERTGLAKSTIHRILQALMQYNMVSQDMETRKYHLGLEVLILGSKALEAISIREIARPYLMKLRDEFGVTAFLSVLNGRRVICVEKFDSPKKLRYFVDVGNMMPPHCAASAKVIMAFQDKKFLDEIIPKLRFLRYTDNTITKRENLLDEYESIKSRGYSVCDKEMEELAIGISAPIFDWDKKVRSSICVLGLTSDLTGSTFEKTIRRTVEAAEEITTIWSGVKRSSEVEIF